MSNGSKTSVRAKKILFLTNAESGQANTILATAHEASTRPNVEVHIASFPILERRVQKLSSKLNFHPLDGKDLVEVLRVQGYLESNLPHPPTTRDYTAYSEYLAAIIAGWDGECGSYSRFGYGQYTRRY